MHFVSILGQLSLLYLQQSLGLLTHRESAVSGCIMPLTHGQCYYVCMYIIQECNIINELFNSEEVMKCMSTNTPNFNTERKVRS